MLEILLALTEHGVPGDFNEVHPALRYEFESAPLMGTLYKNSEGSLSMGGGLFGRHALTDNLGLFGELGLVTGYDAAPIMPMARGGLEIGDRFRVFGFPAVTKDDIGLGLGFETVLGRW